MTHTKGNVTERLNGAEDHAAKLIDAIRSLAESSDPYVQQRIIAITKGVQEAAAPIVDTYRNAVAIPTSVPTDPELPEGVVTMNYEQILGLFQNGKLDLTPTKATLDYWRKVKRKVDGSFFSFLTPDSSIEKQLPSEPFEKLITICEDGLRLMPWYGKNLHIDRQKLYYEGNIQNVISAHQKGIIDGIIIEAYPATITSEKTRYTPVYKWMNDELTGHPLLKENVHFNCGVEVGPRLKELLGKRSRIKFFGTWKDDSRFFGGRQDERPKTVFDLGAHYPTWEEYFFYFYQQQLPIMERVYPMTCRKLSGVNRMHQHMRVYDDNFKFPDQQNEINEIAYTGLHPDKILREVEEKYKFPKNFATRSIPIGTLLHPENIFIF